MIKYCSEAGCGGKTEYTTATPKFCSKCGTPFDKAFKVMAQAKAPIAQKVNTRPVRPVEVEEYEEVEIPIPSASDVQVTVVGKFTIGDLSKVSSPIRESSQANNLPADIQVTSRAPFIIEDLD